MEDKKYYAVMKLVSSLDIMGQNAQLPKGNYIIPVFEDYDEAVEHSVEGKYQILEFKQEVKDE